MDPQVSDRPLSLVTGKVRIEGDVEGKEDLRVDGFVKGSIRISGDLTVGNRGIVEAGVEAENVVIFGRVVGNVTARQHLEIHPGGKLTGDISARSIDIQEGSVFEGRSRMIRGESTAGAPAGPGGGKAGGS